MRSSGRDIWQHSTIAQSRARDVANILDQKYVPTSAKDTTLFLEKTKYMYAIFECTLQTDEGKALIRQHEKDFNV
jgi:hypothetical protein